MISEADITKIREATDIVALISETVVLRQRGTNDYWGCCPFHQEKSPSFHVDATTGLWYCFGCHAKGDMFDFVKKRENLEFGDAARFLAERAHIDIEETQQKGPKGPKRTRLLEALAAAENAYSVRLMRGRSEGADAARKYFASRGFNADICKRWKLGYAENGYSVARELAQAGFSRDELVAADLANVRSGSLRDHFFNRVMFPIHDEQGNCIGFGGRVMGDAKPKYLNTRETPVFHKSKHMFAFDRAKDSIAAKGCAIVTEGYMDVISMHEAGFTNTVAALGTALSLDHVKLLSRFAKTIICMFDGDAAGQHAAQAALKYMESTKASLLCVVLPDNQDPDEFLEAQGSVAMQQQLDSAKPLLDFVLDKHLEELDLSSPGLRLQALDSLSKLLAPLKNSYLLDSYAQLVAGRLGLTLDVVKEKIRTAPIERVEEKPSYAPQGQARPSQLTAQQVTEQEPYMPEQTSHSVKLSMLSAEERTQLKAERNLLALLAKNPDCFRPYADRIATFVWADSRDEAIAWAILATPENTSASDAVIAASRACADAPKILAGSSFATLSSWDTQRNIEFVVNEAEIRSLDRQIASLTANLAMANPSDSLENLKKLEELRSRRNELKAAQSQE